MKDLILPAIKTKRQELEKKRKISSKGILAKLGPFYDKYIRGSVSIPNWYHSMILIPILTFRRPSSTVCGY